MKLLLLPLLLAAAVPLATIASEEEFRTFTDVEGRQIQATIIRATDFEIWIRRKDGKDFRVPVANFSQADRKYIAEWRQTDALKAHNALEFSAGRYTDGSESYTSSTRKVSIAKYGYAVTLANRSPVDLNDLMIEYRLFIRRSKNGRIGQDRPVEIQDGVAYLDLLPSREKRQFKTSTVELTDSRLRSDRYTAGKKRFNDDLRGIRIRIRQRGKIIAEFASPSNLLESERWE